MLIPAAGDVLFDADEPAEEAYIFLSGQLSYYQSPMTSMIITETEESQFGLDIFGIAIIPE